ASSIFFFFQAEDGIRDLIVTGVQTCALPIFSIARALALDPDLLLLDEPFEGLAPAIIPAVSEGIAAITELGRSILIAESNIHHVPEDIRRLYVIERGAILFAGGLQDAWRDPSLTRIIGSAA